jgi:hypothetical protein
MLTHEIRRPRDQSKDDHSTTRRTIPSAGNNQKTTPELQAEIHRRHYQKFWGDIGDTVYFHSGPNRGKKRDRTPWKVVEIEIDPTQTHWTNGGKVPNFIKLEGDLRGKKTTVWTCENKLVNSGVKE